MAPRKKTTRSTKARLSEEERTPKKLKAAEPDLTVVVGGVVFHHYKIMLCSACDFFDTMLSVQMRENEESRIEFPDKDPKEWLELYPFLDSTTKRKPPPITPVNAMKFISWFDYLGMAEKAELCDNVYAAHLSGDYGSLNYFLEIWKATKSKPCPVTHERILGYLRDFLVLLKPKPTPTHHHYGSPTPGTNSGMTAADASKIKKAVLDDVGGEKVWAVVKEHIHLPPQVKRSSRTEIAENPLFEYLLRTGHQNLSWK